MNKIVRLTVCTDSPSAITVSSSNGRVLTRARIGAGLQTFCFRTMLNLLFITATSGDSVQTRCLHLLCTPCQRLYLNFNLLPQDTSEQTIYLVDSNYNLPVPNAIMTFDSRIGENN